MQYSTSIFWSAKRQKYVAFVPEFANLFAFGDTPAEALAQAGLTVEDMLESFVEQGLPLPEPHYLPEHSGQLQLSIPKSLHTSLALEAERQGVSLETYITSVLAREQGKIDAPRVAD